MPSSAAPGNPLASSEVLRLKLSGTARLSRDTGVSSKSLRVAGSQFGDRKALGVSVSLSHPVALHQYGLLTR